MHKISNLVILTTIFLAISSLGLRAETSNLTLTLESGSEHRAVLYDAAGDKAVILLHQMGTTAGSWRSLALPLQENGITSVALTILSSHGVNAAAKKLADMGKSDIVLIGASMGGGIVINTLAEGTPVNVRKVIFLAPTNKGPVLSPNLQKLYIVAKDDVYGKGAYSAFETAAEPKRLIEYSGKAHAQTLFSTEHSEDLTRHIQSFINQ